MSPGLGLNYTLCAPTEKNLSPADVIHDRPQYLQRSQHQPKFCPMRYFPRLSFHAKTALLLWVNQCRTDPDGIVDVVNVSDRLPYGE